MLVKLTGGALGLLLLLALANYFINGTGLPVETWQLLAIFMDTASLGIGVLLAVAPIFILLLPIVYLVTTIGKK